jgi:hypothetical protein
MTKHNAIIDAINSKHNAIIDAINSKSYAYCLQSEYIVETDCSRFTISVNNVVHDLEVYYHTDVRDSYYVEHNSDVYYYTDVRYSYYVDNHNMGITQNINDLTSWF